MLPNKAVIFDLDGTVLDTVGDIADALNLALAAFGYGEHTVERVKSFIGNGSYRLIRRALPESAPESAVLAVRARYIKEYSNATAVKTAPYPQMAELLLELKEAGIKTAVLTNKDDLHAQGLVKSFFGDSVDICRGVREDSEKKPNPAPALSILKTFGVLPENALLVGDGLADYETAKNCGIAYIPVGYGYTPTEVLLCKCGTQPVTAVSELKNEIFSRL